MDVIEANEDIIEDIQDCKLLQSTQQSGETIWTSKRSFKMGLLLQQLGSQGLLNHLFIVEFVKVIPIEATRLANISAG